jgi:hypothetical protein
VPVRFDVQSRIATDSEACSIVKNAYEKSLYTSPVLFIHCCVRGVCGSGGNRSAVLAESFCVFLIFFGLQANSVIATLKHSAVASFQIVTCLLHVITFHDIGHCIISKRRL